MTGKITKINENLKNDPGIVNKSAEKDGWVAELSCTNEAELSKKIYEKMNRDAIGQ